MKNYQTRRDFINDSIKLSVLSALGLSACCTRSSNDSLVPRRVLGKTGLEISQLTFGGGSQFLKNKDGEWELLLEKAIEYGVNMFDTASNYNWGKGKTSEQRYGEILPKYRQKIYISTKFESRNPDEAMKEIEKSLKDLKTDYVDVLLLHSIEKNENIAELESGVYKLMRRLKEEGVARYIGFSSMNSAEKSKLILEKFEIDVCMLAMNPTQYGSFAKNALPVAQKKNVGVFAMKVMKNLVGESATASELMDYALSADGVASACIAHFGMSILEENIKIVRNRTVGNIAIHDRHELENRMAHLSGPHVLSWARPDYRDGMMC